MRRQTLALQLLQLLELDRDMDRVENVVLSDLPWRPAQLPFVFDSRELHPVSLRTHFELVDSVHPDYD